MTNHGDIDLLGSATARLHAYLKRHPKLRSRLIATFTGITSLVDRLVRGRRSGIQGYVRPHAWVEDQASAGSVSRPRITDVLAGETAANTPPIGIHPEIDPEYFVVSSVEIPRPFVAEIPGGHVLGEHGAVVTPDGSIVERASRPVGSLMGFLSAAQVDHMSPTALHGDWIRRPRRLGRAAVLSAYVGRGYFHWLFDVLPRLSLLQAAGIELSSIDHFIVPSYFARYQIETLARFGIDRERVVSSFSNRHVVADDLIVPSLARETGLTPRWVCDFLRQTYAPRRPAGVDPMRRVYIIRKNTDHGLVENEERLDRILRDRGFAPVAMEDYSLEEKAWILGQAEVVASPSGGGLTNIVFCEPGTKIVELRVQDYPIMDGWDIANRLGLPFYDVLPVGYQRSQAMHATTSGSVADEAVAATLDLAGVT